MIVFILSLAVCVHSVLLTELKCLDWQGNVIADGEEFYPKANDHCYLCRCHQGFETMCKTVSCAPPICQHIKIEGECCTFACVDKGGIGNGMENITGVPPGGGGVEGSPTDSTMTDLGLRLVASTVTTFLILALLLFLIHRFRQRRLLMTLRRYSRRRDPMDDMDSINYTPDFFGIQCPPYEDPPPPYTPPKPHPGEQPPPYEAIEGGGNQQTGGGNQSQSRSQNGEAFTSPNCDRHCHNANENLLHSTDDSNSNSPLHEVTNRGGGQSHHGNVITTSGNIINSNGNVIPANGSPRNGSSLPNGHLTALCGNSCLATRLEHNSANHQVRADNSCNNPLEHNAFQQQSGACRIPGFEAATNSADGGISVHFRNSNNGPPGITMGVLNRNRHSRNRYSDGIFNSSPVRNTPNRNTLSENTAALNLELRNTVRHV